MTLQHLGEFLQQEIDKRRLSVHGFAQMIGVTHTTIRKYLEYEEKDVSYPSIEFLIKLAEGTQTDIRYLVTLIVPVEKRSLADFDEEYLTLLERITQLPPTYRKIIDVIIETGLAERDSNNDSD